MNFGIAAEICSTRRIGAGGTDLASVPLAFFESLGFLGWLFGGYGFQGGFGLGCGGHYGLRAPEVHRNFCDFLGRIAEFGVEAEESGVSGLDGIRVNLLEFLETLVAEDFAHSGIVVA